MLRVGDGAPSFLTSDVTGNPVSLLNVSDRYVLLVFLRYAGCPWCNLAIHRLAMEYPMLKKAGCEVIAFVQSSKEQVEANIYGRHAIAPQFSIIADKERILYDLYDVKSFKSAVVRSIRQVPYWLQATFKHGFRQTEVDGDLFLVPALFLIDTKTNQIAFSKYSSSFYEHETFTDIYEHLTFERV